VGKEILAEALHMRSHRGDAPFVRVNCAAMPDNLLESEMFGFEKGAFTGAGQPKPGLLEVANGGTMLLDEVGELGPATQVKLLRVLESRELMRLGALKPRPVDVRFVSATNRPLQALIEAGTFRRDLYHRLDGITLTIPPLRERREDILPLAHAFARAFAIEHDFPVPAIDAEAKSLLENHAWPGNIRELKNAVERACLLGQGGNITPQYLRLDDASAAVEQAASSASTKLRSELEALERERILEALEQTGGNQTRAAALLGIGRRTLVNRIEAYGLPRPRKGGPSGSS
jgi:transcriptional regulator with PAS, ATPase and Fis domain